MICLLSDVWSIIAGWDFSWGQKWSTWCIPQNLLQFHIVKQCCETSFRIYEVMKMHGLCMSFVRFIVHRLHLLLNVSNVCISFAILSVYMCKVFLIFVKQKCVCGLYFALYIVSNGDNSLATVKLWHYLKYDKVLNNATYFVLFNECAKRCVCRFGWLKNVLMLLIAPINSHR